MAKLGHCGHIRLGGPPLGYFLGILHPISRAWYNSERLESSSLLGARHASTYYSVHTQQGIARVPLLKSDMFVGDYTDRCMRSYNEDRYFAGILDLPRRQSNSSEQATAQSESEKWKVFNFAVFDGHGGPDCAQFLADNLATYVENVDMSSGRQIADEFRKRIGGYWRAWRSNLLRYERQLNESKYDDLALRLPLAYLQADLDFTAKNETTGSTCTSAYIYALDPHRPYWERGAAANIVVAQVGDSRAILADNTGNVLALTSIHHPSSPHETDRLHDYRNSFVFEADGSQRFIQFANTRAFGDLQGKARGLSAEPDITMYDLGQGRSKLPGEEAFLILVTDGVTDKASDQELADLVIQNSSSWGSKRGTPQRAAAEIVRYVENLGTRDNSTAMVIRLGGWGHWSSWTDRSGQLRSDRLHAGELRRQ